ncbi:MAG TPA: TonB-dependent receptor [Longimicrobiaceae bacterium]|nr:TonB-dependent receptor [Longimicrobiaceae bacterium]
MTKTRMRMAVLALLALVLGLALPGTSRAQGVTTAAVTGTVTNEAGQPVAGARVTVRNAATGFSRTVGTDQGGRYFVPNLAPGGPYTVSAEALGQAAQPRSGIQLVLNQTTTVDLRLAAQAVAIEGITVTGGTSAVISPTRTGAATILGEETIESLPTITRNFTEVATLSPYVTGLTSESVSIGGANNRYNNIQIDGATTSDLFGLGSTGTPGGQGTAAKPIPLDAIEQFQVLVSPFDIRQTGFTGGLINAVTKAGTNDFRGSLFMEYRDQNLVRGDTLRGYGRTFSPPLDFSAQILGATLRGPIVRDRLHFSFSGELEQRETPELFSATSDPATIRVTERTINRVVTAAQRFGIDPGGAGAFTREVSMSNLFGRLDYRINPSHRVVLRHNYAPKSRDDAGLTRGGSTFDLSSYNFNYKTDLNSTVLQLFSQFGDAFSNEFQFNYQTIRDRPTPAVRYSIFEVVTNDSIGGRPTSGLVRGGAEIARQANELDQDLIQATNNLTWDRGAHRLTFGVNGEYYKFRNLFVQGVLGTYRFASPAAFEAGTPQSYTANVPLREDLNARFSVFQPGLYAQDVWTVNDNLTLTAGVRVDVPYLLDEPEENTRFTAGFGQSNSITPSGNPLFSPRVGFNLQFGDAVTTQIRGGVGVFSGRPPYVWVSNAFSNTGNDFASLTCTGTNVPAFTPNAPPTACRSGAGPAPPAIAPPISTLAEDYVFPQDLKASLGLDRELFMGITGTFEAIYTRGLNQTFAREINLQGSQNVSATSRQGLGDRVIYGTPQNESAARFAFNPVRRVAGFQHVVELVNADESSHQLQLVTELARSFGRNFDLRASYSFQRARDVQSLTSSVATSNIGFHPVGRTVNEQTVTPSSFERPHKITLYASARVLPQFGGTELTAAYIGQSGRTYSYVYDGDINGDGYESSASGIGGRNNDLVYIPNDINEIVFRTDNDRRLFQELVEKEECLQESRGRIMERNSCRGPWVNEVNVGIAQTIPTGRFGQGLTIEANILNFLNLLNADWGLQQGPQNNTVNLLDYAGRQTAGNVNSAPTFTYDGFVSTSNGVQSAELPYTTFFGSRYQIQLSVRYRF